MIIKIYSEEVIDDIRMQSRLMAASIIDEFEELLEEKDIDIPNEDRTGHECEAHLYGSDYYALEDKISDILFDALFKMMSK